MILIGKEIEKIIESNDKVIIAGNACSGKSTLVEELKGKEFPEIRNHKNFNDFINSNCKFSTIFCPDTESINERLNVLEIKIESNIGVIFANPDFTYSKI